MIPEPFKKQKKSIQAQFELRWKLLKPLLRKYKKPVIVHAIHEEKVFRRVLKEEKLKLPRSHQSPQKTPYLEKVLGLDNCLWYSLGFVYHSSYHWKWNLLFDLNSLKNLEYYTNAVNFKAARKVIEYWHDHDKKYLDKFEKTNAITREVMHTYYHKSFAGNVRKNFEFWKVEKELYQHIMNYPHKKKLIRLMKKEARNLRLLYPASKKDAIVKCLTVKAPEMVKKSENTLSTNPHFLGFFIPGHIGKRTLTVLKEKYLEKILYDGKKIRKIKQI